MDILTFVELNAALRSESGEPNYSALGRQFGRDRRTIKKIIENARDGFGLHARPTGGQMNSAPTLQPVHLAYIQARARHRAPARAAARALALAEKVRCFAFLQSSPPAQALNELYPDIYLSEIRDAVMQDLGVENLSVSQVHRAVVDVLHRTLKNKTEVVRRLSIFYLLRFAATAFAERVSRSCLAALFSSMIFLHLLPLFVAGAQQVHGGEHVRLRDLCHDPAGAGGEGQRRLHRRNGDQVPRARAPESKARPHPPAGVKVCCSYCCPVSVVWWGGVGRPGERQQQKRCCRVVRG